jgi:hypothetical protein
MGLYNRLKETAISDVDDILKGRKVSASAKKLIEAGVLLNHSAEPTQRAYGLDFIKTAVKELEPEEEPAIKSGDVEAVKEEVLSNHNVGSRGTGSEQSSDNTEPYPKEGTDTPDNDIEGMDSATGENQMKEGIGMPPPQQNGMMPNMMPGMDPTIAQEMGQHMGQIPPMSTPQQMQQMQYMINTYHKRFVAPMNNTIKVQRETIQKLSKQIQETQFSTGSKSLDLTGMKQNSNARIRETIPTDPSQASLIGRVPTYTNYDKNVARREISDMNKQMNSSYR